MIKIKENINNVDEFNLLYDLVGWGAYDKEISRKALNNTYYSVSVYDDNKIKISIRDRGCGIEDIEKAKTPLFTTLGGERAGLGFAVMESFTDKLTVRSALGRGTTVTMIKKTGGREN